MNNKEIKTITIVLVLLAGIFLNILPPVPGTNGTEGTQGQPGPGSMVILPSVDGQLSNTIPPYDNSPYSFQWWYSTPQHPDEYQPYDPDIDNDGKKKQDWIKQDDRKDIRYCTNSGYWNGDKCIIEDVEENAAYEDAVCDDPKDTQKYAKLCGGGSGDDGDSSKDKDDNDNDNTATADNNKLVAIANIPYNNDHHDDSDNADNKKDDTQDSTTSSSSSSSDKGPEDDKKQEESSSNNDSSDNDNDSGDDDSGSSDDSDSSDSSSDKDN